MGGTTGARPVALGGLGAVAMGVTVGFGVGAVATGVTTGAGLVASGLGAAGVLIGALGGGALTIGVAFGATTGLVALGGLAVGVSSGLEDVPPPCSSCSGSTFVDGRGFCRRKAAAAF